MIKPLKPQLALAVEPNRHGFITQALVQTDSKQTAEKMRLLIQRAYRAEVTRQNKLTRLKKISKKARSRAR